MDWQQKLFDYFYQEHGIMLLNGDFNEVYHIMNDVKCTFHADNTTTTATRCKFCGKEKWEHSL